MTKSTDIRDKTDLTGDELFDLNFIHDSGRYSFRKYYRSGLRSHIFEVLLKEDLLQEINGILDDGIRIFPRACPKKIFRIFRDQFSNTDEIFQEIRKYNLLLNVLGSDFIALSEEFIVDYRTNDKNHILLCGLQEYVKGEILDPWKIYGTTYLAQFFNSFYSHSKEQDLFVSNATNDILDFTEKIRRMIIDHRYIPDLAGIGNLLIMPSGHLKLVDINNIVKVCFSDDILLDDKGYPSCDVSIQVLFMLEKMLLDKPSDPEDPLFKLFLAENRKTRVKILEKKFYDQLASQTK